MPATHAQPRRSNAQIALGVWGSLSWLDRLLSLFILIAMVLGVLIGEFAPQARERLAGTGAGTLQGVSAPLVVGLLVMMWPILTKVHYERFPQLLRSANLWAQITLSLLLNWLIAPLLMLALAEATLPDLPTYRTGIVLVGLARCIAMVMVWTNIAKGEPDMCAILVIVNSALQIVLYAPMAVLFIDVISNAQEHVHLEYSKTAIAVLIYLGIPLSAGVLTRFSMQRLLGTRRFDTHFLPYFGILSLVGLLYTILIIFASQSKHILRNLGPSFRTIVPLVLYFSIMWSATFAFIYALNRRASRNKGTGRAFASLPAPACVTWDYQAAVLQSFTAASNNFELAIAVAVAIYGADSDQALAATVGPLVEIPVLLLLTWLSLFFRARLNWGDGGGAVPRCSTMNQQGNVEKTAAENAEKECSSDEERPGDPAKSSAFAIVDGEKQ
ncbi:arsenical-resistance protein [Tilletiaria anomala UBC 951]|uniref:Arsenical-resistance protein n=1 Tax=Tilletiaria anomala (strain ATCC 24038 / CBS 436.72 / UBC 951) TaxID=1037660 RepID=A0A066W5A1_TILAU|nr:arsenical-resistance protein [Tilletiaria anomala UBC 951]KDN45945.1 arsenical-resistance protein [Tilletiaria anomala UBC 951]